MECNEIQEYSIVSDIYERLSIELINKEATHADILKDQNEKVSSESNTSNIYNSLSFYSSSYA